LKTSSPGRSAVFKIDVQGLVIGQEQNLEMFEESTSIMASRNLQAPRPPGSSLAEPSIIRAKQLLEALNDRDRDIIVTKQLKGSSRAVQEKRPR
jgi:hypothetical protein